MNDNKTDSEPSFDQIAETVRARGGFKTVQMELLRDAYDAGKLGEHVVRGISQALAQNGLGHFPNPLPRNQHEEVRLYVLGSPVARLIDAVLTPGDGADRVLGEFTQSETTEIVRKIRELVCD